MLGKMSSAWRMLESLNRDLETAHYSSFVDAFLDQDDFLVESLLRLSNIHSSCRSVTVPVVVVVVVVSTGWCFNPACCVYRVVL